MKKEIGELNATPSKRTFLSIIADYDLNRSICELVDNGLDVWVRQGSAKPITVLITLNEKQQIITVQDDAGGVRESELSYIVGPGQSGTNPTDATIGMFGVGTKRAVVALAQDITIKTRFAKERTLQVEFDDQWLATEDWDLKVYEVDQISPRTTIVELKSLRIQLTEENIGRLKRHLRATYALFLKNKSVSIFLNGEKLTPKTFEKWAYPPRFTPRRFVGSLRARDGYELDVKIVAGLIRESSPAAGEYGVYFYCNNRLVARALKTYDVGFTRGLAGLPHARVSLTRVIVFLNGDARGMPWNSSKSDINTKHEVFVALHDWIVKAVKGYASLSRIWVGEWPEKVFHYETGKIKEIRVTDFPDVPSSLLPPLPKSKPRYGDVIEKRNKNIAKSKPWTRGLFEGVIAVDLLSKQHLEQKNRLALIVLDSTLEIAFKEYLVHDSGQHYTDSQISTIFARRHQVHAEIKKYITLDQDVWKKIKYYYDLRSKLIHERTTVGISDPQIDDFRELVEVVLNKLYKLKFSR